MHKVVDNDQVSGVELGQRMAAGRRGDRALEHERRCRDLRQGWC